MENKKNLEIDCATCDIRNVTEELLSTYEKVVINTATLITSPEAQALLGRYGAEIDTACNVNLERDTRFSTVNGPMTLSKGQVSPDEKMAMIVNGPLTVEPDCEEVLKKYEFMVVNGPVTCPESMTSLLSSFNINGPVRAYPDGAILLKKDAVLDRLFHLRAKQDALYYAAGRIIALAGDINFQKLAEKNVRFVTRRLIVSESLAEAAVPLFDEKTDIMVLPDGCAYVDDDATLDGALVKRYGGKLFVDGDLTIHPDSASVLDQISYLRVNGDLRVPKTLKDIALNLDATYDRLKVVGGVLISARGEAAVTRELLEQAGDGVSVTACGTVTFLPDVPAELIREKLVSIGECGTVVCTQEQLAAIEAVAAGIGCMGPRKVPADNSAEDPGEEDRDTVRIDAAFYTL